MTTEWQDSAACRGLDPGIFVFDLSRGTPTVRERRLVARAKAVCAECDVQAECLAYAIAHDEQGVWGGTSEAERRHTRWGGNYVPVGRPKIPRDQTHHGTEACYRMHRRDGTEPCLSCRQAHAAYQATTRASRAL